MTWGGARNRSVTTALTRKQADAVIAAASRAIAIGLPFNRFVTIHWTRAGLTDDIAARATGRLMKLASDWVTKRGAQISWAWVRENDDGDGCKGSHTHILLYAPTEVPIGRMFRRWLRRTTGQPYRPGSIKSERIGGTLNSYSANPSHYTANLDRVIAYVIKGVTSADAVKLGLPRHEAGGCIIGKRAAVSQTRTLFSAVR